MTAANARLKVATVCMNAVLDKEANLQTFYRYMKEAAAQGVQLIIFPEVSLQQNPSWGFLSVHEPTQAELKYLRDTAETVPGKSTDSIVAKARELDIYVVFGMTEKESEDGPLYNTSVFLGPDGVIGKYRKNNLWDAENGEGNEHLCWKRGTELVVADSPWGKVGLMICIDMAHLLGPKLAARGADLLVTASAWPRVAGDNYEKHTVQNAVEAQRWHVVSNQVGPVGYGEDYGHSRIIHPNGEIVADTGGREGMVIAEVDLYVGRDSVQDR
jgi:predicted amidohydrolase